MRAAKLQRVSFIFTIILYPSRDHLQRALPMILVLVIILAQSEARDHRVRVPHPHSTTACTQEWENEGMGE